MCCPSNTGGSWDQSSEKRPTRAGELGGWATTGDKAADTGQRAAGTAGDRAPPVLREAERPPETHSRGATTRPSLSAWVQGRRAGPSWAPGAADTLETGDKGPSLRQEAVRWDSQPRQDCTAALLLPLSHVPARSLMLV